MKRLAKMTAGGVACLVAALVTLSLAYDGATAGMPRGTGYMAQIGLLAATAVLAITGLVLLVKSVVRVFDR